MLAATLTDKSAHNEEFNVVIWKYDIADGPGVVTTLDMPRGARVLTAQLQGREIVLWAEVDPKAPNVERRFTCVVTGFQQVPPDCLYIATVQIMQAPAPYVVHIYEVL